MTLYRCDHTGKAGMDNIPPRMLTAREAAKLLHMSRQNVLDRVKRGTIKGSYVPGAYATGYYVLISEDEVERVKRDRGGRKK